jgi:predicted amidohydrolase
MTTKKPARPSVARSKGAQVKKSAPQAGTCRVAAIQMASGPNVASNLAEAEQLIELAVEAGARLVVLPEFFCIMALKDADVVKAREAEGHGPIQTFLSRMAKKHKIWLVGGSLPLEASVANKVRNSCLVYDDRGKRIARYDKIHLFGLDLGNERYQEARLIEPGDKVVIINSPFGRIGLSICYDLRFPELYRAMPDVDIIVVPSAFTATTGRAHLATQIRPRASEHRAPGIPPAPGGNILGARTFRNPDPRARDREPRLRDRPGAGRLSFVGPRNPRRQHDRRPLGRGARPPDARVRRRHRQHQPRLPGQPQKEPARAAAPLHPVPADRSRSGRTPCGRQARTHQIILNPAGSGHRHEPHRRLCSHPDS